VGLCKSLPSSLSLFPVLSLFINQASFNIHIHLRTWQTPSFFQKLGQVHQVYNFLVLFRSVHRLYPRPMIRALHVGRRGSFLRLALCQGWIAAQLGQGNNGRLEKQGRDWRLSALTSASGTHGNMSSRTGTGDTPFTACTKG